jgi:hypothetical protein
MKPKPGPKYPPTRILEWMQACHTGSINTRSFPWRFARFRVECIRGQCAGEFEISGGVGEVMWCGVVWCGVGGCPS